MPAPSPKQSHPSATRVPPRPRAPCSHTATSQQTTDLIALPRRLRPVTQPWANPQVGGRLRSVSQTRARPQPRRPQSRQAGWLVGRASWQWLVGRASWHRKRMKRKTRGVGVGPSRQGMCLSLSFSCSCLSLLYSFSCTLPRCHRPTRTAGPARPPGEELSHSPRPRRFLLRPRERDRERERELNCERTRPGLPLAVSLSLHGHLCSSQALVATHQGT